MDKEVLKAINDLAKRINEVQQKMDAFAIQLSDKNKAEIDYIAMMEEIEIPESEVIENE